MIFVLSDFPNQCTRVSFAVTFFFRRQLFKKCSDLESSHACQLANKNVRTDGISDINFINSLYAHSGEKLKTIEKQKDFVGGMIAQLKLPKMNYYGCLQDKQDTF